MIYEICSRLDGKWNFKIYNEKVLDGVTFAECVTSMIRDKYEGGSRE